VQSQVSITWPQYLRFEATINGKLHRFQPTSKALDVLLCLVLRYPNFSDEEDIITYLYPNPDEEPEEISVYTLIDYVKRHGVKLECLYRGKIDSDSHKGWRIEPDKSLLIVTQKPMKCQALNVDKLLPSYGKPCKRRATSQLNGKWLCQHHQHYFRKYGRLKTVDKSLPMPYKAVRRTKYGN
jgi:hypothetical protein